MPTTLTPLRYPGGKTALYEKVVSILEQNSLHDITYVEPFVGGAGLAIKLLLRKNVSHIVINDIDPAIHSFWHSVLNQPEDLCRRIMECKISIEERENQSQILKNQEDNSIVDVGFATLYLNRTNVSGILDAGPIGGKDQEGDYKLDARFNKTRLITKINKIASCRQNIQLYGLDVIDFMDEVLPAYEVENLFLNFDPPYVKQGQALYLNHFTIKDHQRLRNKVADCEHHWIVTYDFNNIILDLYSAFEYERIQLNHSAGSMKKGEEIIIYSHNLQPLRT